jgi:hypothetical protein
MEYATVTEMQIQNAVHSVTNYCSTLRIRTPRARRPSTARARNGDRAEAETGPRAFFCCTPTMVPRAGLGD